MQSILRRHEYSTTLGQSPDLIVVRIWRYAIRVFAFGSTEHFERRGEDDARMGGAD